MKKTIFAGLTVLEPGEGLDSDNGAFIGKDREVIDQLLHVGAKTHRHTGLNGLTNPAYAPGAVITGSAGTIPANLDINVGFTLEDENGGETMLSPTATVSTREPVSSPPAAPSGVANYAGGSLLINTYFYAVTFTDGEGGETSLGPPVQVQRAPGYASGQIQLSQLNFGLGKAGGAGWRLYRAIGGGSYCLLATGGAGTSEFLDNGTTQADCSVHPPAGEGNTTRGVSTLLVTLPSTGLASAATINLYATVTGVLSGGSLLGTYPVASAGAVVVFQSLELQNVSPPDVNLSIGGAHQIDPDTELIEWHWKRPVGSVGELPAGEEGDVRMVGGFVSPTAYVYHDGSWEPWQSGGSGTTGPWVKAAMLNEWVSTSAPEWPAASRVKGDIVELAGGMASGNRGECAFVLPVGSRPQAVVRLGIGEGRSNAGLTVEIRTNGEVIPIAEDPSGCTFYLTGLSFPIGTPP